MSNAFLVEDRTADKFSLGYRPELDGLRGIAIFIVVSGHIFWWPGVPGAGVDLFFVLSGFLITRLLLEERARNGSVSLTRFYQRRVLRLAPALVIFCAATFMAGECRLDDLAFVATYTTNYAIAFGKLAPENTLCITWSLSIEEQFYLLWPAILTTWLTYKRALAQLSKALIVLLVAMEAWRGLLMWRGFSFVNLYYQTDTHGQALVIGCLLGTLADRLSRFFTARGNGNGMNATPQQLRLIAWICLSISLVIRMPVQDYCRGLILSATIMALLVVSATFAPIWPFRLKPIIWLGRVSYGLYLWHWLILSFFPITEPTMSKRLPILILSLLAAVLSYFLWEAPFLRLKKRLETRNEVKC